jgi:hypothetical protein
VRTAFIGMVFTLTAIAALACTTSQASAQQLSVGELRAEFRAARLHQQTAAEEASIAAGHLAGALELQAQRGSFASGDLHDTDRDPLADSPLPIDLAAALLADGVVSDEEIAALEQVAAAKRAAAERWAQRVDQLRRRLERREQIARWNRQGNWWPLIKIAGDKYGVAPAGLRRMMMMESGGRSHLGGTFIGLFQYHPSTWRGTWNPWRQLSIHDGWAQIRATAYALHKGMGPSQWPNTYPRAF